MGGGAAILKQATAARRSSLERNPADYPGIKVIIRLIDYSIFGVECTVGLLL
jgi:hypothetical protein